MYTTQNEINSIKSFIENKIKIKNLTHFERADQIAETLAIGHKLYNRLWNEVGPQTMALEFVWDEDSNDFMQVHIPNGYWLFLTDEERTIINDAYMAEYPDRFIVEAA